MSHVIPVIQLEAPIQVSGVNIAPQAYCTQSSLSVHSLADDEANRLVNNPGREGDYAQHTDYEENPWIQLDFGRIVRYDEILVFNRLFDSNGMHLAERARTMVVDISTDGEGWFQIHAGDSDAPPFGGTDGNPLRILTPGYETRYIRFRLQETNWFHLVAIEVYQHQS
ncbi:MAG: discoidin domain-containing protein [Synechococcus sp. ELA057]